MLHPLGRLTKAIHRLLSHQIILTSKASGATVETSVSRLRASSLCVKIENLVPSNALAVKKHCACF